MRRNISLLTGIALLIITVLAIYSFRLIHSESILSQQFEEVLRFSREAEFSKSYSGSGMIQTDIEAKGGEHIIAELYKNNSKEKIMPIPKHDCYIMITPFIIFLYDNLSKEIGRFNIEDLSLTIPSDKGTESETGGFVFEDCIGITDNTIFVEINYTWDNMLSSTINHLFLELAIYPSCDSFKLHDCGKYYGICMNESCTTVFLLSPNPDDGLGVNLRDYEIESGKVSQLKNFENIPGWFPTTIRYNAKLGDSLILGFKNETSHLACFNHKDNTLEFLAKADNAYWMDDNNIYFNRGNQLWRTTQDGHKELVFCPEKIIKDENFFNQIRIGVDKTFFVFDYISNDSSDKESFGRLMVDLNKKEYRNINKGKLKKLSSTSGTI